MRSDGSDGDDEEDKRLARGGWLEAFDAESRAECQPEADEEGDGKVNREIGGDGFERAAGVVDDGKVGLGDAGLHAGLASFLQGFDVEGAAAVAFLAHDGELRGGGVLHQALRGGVFQAGAEQAFAAFGGVHGAAKALNDAAVFKLDLAGEVGKLGADFDGAREVGAVFLAELREFLFEGALLRVQLAQKRHAARAVRAGERGVRGEDEFGVAMSGGQILGLAAHALGAGVDHLATELVDALHHGGVLNLVAVALRVSDWSVDEAVFLLKSGQVGLVAIDGFLELDELTVEPAGGLRGGVHMGIGGLLVVGADEAVDDGSGEGGVVRAEADLHDQGAGHGAGVKIAREALQQPRLRGWVGVVDVKGAEADGKVGGEGGRGVETQIADDAPGELVAVQHCGHGFQLGLAHGAGGGTRRLRTVEVEGGVGRGAEGNAGAGFKLFGGEEAVGEAGGQRKGENAEEDAATAAECDYKGAQ